MSVMSKALIIKSHLILVTCEVGMEYSVNDWLVVIGFVGTLISILLIQFRGNDPVWQKGLIVCLATALVLMLIGGLK